MKKKVILSVFLVLLLFVTGCGKTETVNDNKGTSEEKKVLEATIGDLKVELDRSGSFNGISYKYPSKATTSSFGTYNIMDYMNGKDFVFRIAMYFFENKKLDEAMGETKELNKKTINGKEWHIYEDKSQNGEDMLVYAYQHKSGTYTITFIYAKDISNFIDVFMNTIKFD